jgi:hypothetical protein
MSEPVCLCGDDQCEGPFTGKHWTSDEYPKWMNELQEAINERLAQIMIECGNRPSITFLREGREEKGDG